MAAWTFLTSHARVLICVAREPGIRLRDVAEEVGLTERATYRIVDELEAGGYLTRHRMGHRNFYEVHPETEMRHPMLADRRVGELLALFRER